MATKPPLRVIQFGLGPIGLAAAELVRRKQSLRLVGAVEIDPDRRDSAVLGVPVAPTLSQVLSQCRADVVIHATGSRLAAVASQLREIISAGLHCVSSAEELIFPIGRNRFHAKRLDKIALRHGVVLLGTGVNPGFVMDLLPVILSSTCQSVARLGIRRVVDVAARRVQLQRKVGVGLDRSRFRALLASGRLGHVGLRESAHFVAAGLRWKLDKLEEQITPILRRNRVAGTGQVVRGWRGGRLVLTLELHMEAGARNPRDEIHIEGAPSLSLVIPGGVQGDQATAAILVNAIPLAVAARPGLRTLLDLAAPRFLE